MTNIEKKSVKLIFSQLSSSLPKTAKGSSVVFSSSGSSSTVRKSEYSVGTRGTFKQA